VSAIPQGIADTGGSSKQPHVLRTTAATGSSRRQHRVEFERTSTRSCAQVICELCRNHNISFFLPSAVNAKRTCGPRSGPLEDPSNVRSSESVRGRSIVDLFCSDLGIISVN